MTTRAPAASQPGGEDETAPRLSRTLGLRRSSPEPGRGVVEWDAPPEYGFPTRSGHIIQGGIVATVLDSAMGAATRSILERDAAFLTADLRLEFLRATRPGALRAEARVVRGGRRVIFCAAELFDADGEHLASARCTQVVLGTQERRPRPGPQITNNEQE